MLLTGCMVKSDERLARTNRGGVMEFIVTETSVAAPWGGEIPVAYAIPNKPRAH